MKNKLPITIRQANVEDSRFIGQAEREIAEEPGYFCSQPFEISDDKIKQSIINALNSIQSIYLVAEYENNLVGHAFLEPYSVLSLSHVADLNIAVNRA